MKYSSKKYKNHKSDFIKSLFNTIGTCILLVIINKTVSPHHFWAKIPIMIMIGSMIFKGFKILGHKVSENLNSNPEYQSEFKDDLRDLKNDFDLKSLSHRNYEPQKLWKDSELVKSNLS